VGTRPDPYAQAFVQFRADQARPCAYKLRNSGGHRPWFPATRPVGCVASRMGAWWPPTSSSRPSGPWTPWPRPPRPKASPSAAARSAASCKPKGSAGARCAPGAEAATLTSPKRAAIIALYTTPPAGVTVVCADELGPVIPHSFPPAPGWSTTAIASRRRWSMGVVGTRPGCTAPCGPGDGQAVTLAAPSRDSAGYQQLLGLVEAANPNLGSTLSVRHGDCAQALMQSRADQASSCCLHAAELRHHGHPHWSQAELGGLEGHGTRRGR
jgi:hypothetical protein